jgi:hypothetical protein
MFLPNQNKFDSAEYTLITTTKPYDNNYFFDHPSTTIIISFSEWNALTSLPISNGLVYFVCTILAHHLRLGPAHRKNSGCVQDFLWDKRGVDVAMRAAFVCAKCKANFAARKATKEAKTIFSSLKQFWIAYVLLPVLPNTSWTSGCAVKTHHNSMCSCATTVRRKKR